MQVHYSCPECQSSCRKTLDESPNPSVLVCEGCSARLEIPRDGMVDGQVVRCLVCPSTELYVRKDMPQRLGVGIVVIGLALSCVAWYGHHVVATFVILFGTALCDAVLYLFMGNVLQCYRCQAQYRGVQGLASHAPFNLETHERHRQQAARMAEARPVAVRQRDLQSS